MAQAAIGAALKAHVGLLSFVPPIPLSWPNKDYKPDGERFIQVQILPAPNERLTIRGKHRTYGSMILTVASRTANGSGEGDGLADAVAAHFPCDLKLDAGGQALRITESPSIREGFLEGNFWRTPVVIPYEVLA